jgi:hypothetical protein
MPGSIVIPGKRLLMTVVAPTWRQAGVLVATAAIALGFPRTDARAQADSNNSTPLPPTASAVATTTPTTASPTDVPESAQAQATSEAKVDPEPRRNLTMLERVRLAFSQDEDSDGQINTDRPTFTPANTVVPLGRLQIESGFTFNYQPTGRTKNELYDAPELALRYGIFERAEFRTFWQGITDDETQSPSRRPTRFPGGTSDMEVGFKWQLLPEDKEQKWRPTTALITSIIAPTGGSSRLSNQTVEPYINLIYGWSLSDKLTFGGSTAYLGVREQPPPGTEGRTVSFQRWSQSLLSFYSLTDRTTLFYEWYVLMFTGAPNNLPTHFMDGGILYHPTPNTQIDLRAGFGLSGRPDDFFTGTGVSFRF